MSKTDEALRLTSEARAMLDEGDRSGRRLTLAERQVVQGKLDRVQSLKTELAVERAGYELGVASGTGGDIGSRFVRSPEYQRIKNADSRAQVWTTGPIDLGPFSTKGTVTQTTTGPGGGLTPAYYEPGIVEKQFEPNSVTGLFGQSQTTGGQVRYVVEGTALSGAAGVPEGGVKPESTLVLSEVVEPVKKIATVTHVSDELLEDADSVQSYMSRRLSLFVENETERQLLRGAGTDDLVGLMAAGRGINTYSTLAADDNATALARVIANTAGSANVMPDGIVLHPAQWLNLRLLRDGTGGTAGQFLGGGPFTGAYGQGGPTGIFGESIWGLRVALSTVVGAGTALIGNFSQSAHIWRRGGLSVEVSSSHDQHFVRNLNAIRAEHRLALGCYRPSAFTEVRGLN
jgi:HK97 family phage major capsid protein